MDLAASIPFDEAIVAADRSGVAVIDHDPSAPAVLQIDRLADWLQEAT
jgi:hypothetical protein